MVAQEVDQAVVTFCVMGGGGSGTGKETAPQAARDGDACQAAITKHGEAHTPVHAAPVKAPLEPHVYEPPPLYPVTQVTVTVSPVTPARLVLA